MKRNLLLGLFLYAMTGHAYQNTTLNLSAAGGRMQSARFTTIGTLSPVGGSTTFSSTYCNHSGFAAGFILQPETAFSGLADEWNPDNDLDRLMDGEEIIAGSSLWKGDTDNDGLGDFDEVKIHGSHPALADSDSDGMDDDLELIAGTSPTNGASLFTVHCEVQPSGGRILSWHGVNERYYTFEYTTELGSVWKSLPFEFSGFNQTISFRDDAALPARFYRVKVRK